MPKFYDAMGNEICSGHYRQKITGDPYDLVSSKESEDLKVFSYPSNNPVVVVNPAAFFGQLLLKRDYKKSLEEISA